MVGIEVLARALIVQKGQVLLVRRLGASHTFLPGGHVKVGETLEDALARELREECDGDVEVGDFLGAIEYFFEGEEGTVHELSLVFECRLGNHGPPVPPRPREPHLEFLWQRVDRLKEVNLQPWPLVDAVSGFAQGIPFPRWRSTFKERPSFSAEQGLDSGGGTG